MKDLTFDLTREFIVQHKHELRSIVISVGKFLPEEGDQLSFAHLDPAHVAAITAFCGGSTEFLVEQVAMQPGYTEAKPTRDLMSLPVGLTWNEAPAGRQPDRARILVKPIFGSNFSAANLICQPIHQEASLRSLPEQEIPAVSESTEWQKLVEQPIFGPFHASVDPCADLPPPQGITAYLPWMRAASA